MADTRLLVSRLTGFALGAEAPDIPEDTDYSALIGFARKHSVSALVGKALEQLTTLPEDIKAQFQSDEKNAIYREAVMDIECGDLVQELNDAGITFMLLKGSVMKDLYPAPYLRTMCDLDIQYDTARIEDVRKIMEKRGYTLSEQSGSGGVNLQYQRQPVMTVEMHGVLMDRDIPLYNSYFGTDFSRTLPAGGCQRKYSDEDFYIFMLAHYAKHYFSGGIGIRNTADLWLYRRKMPDLDDEYIKGELEKINLVSFEKSILSAAAAMLEGAAPDELTKKIILYIFDSETYGIETHVNTRNADNGRFSFVLTRLFPGMKFMCVRYPVLRRLPVLLPVMWIVRLADVTIKGRFKGSDVQTALIVSDDELDARMLEGKPEIDLEIVKNT